MHQLREPSSDFLLEKHLRKSRRLTLPSSSSLVNSTRRNRKSRRCRYHYHFRCHCRCRCRCRCHCDCDCDYHFHYHYHCHCLHFRLRCQRTGRCRSCYLVLWCNGGRWNGKNNNNVKQILPCTHGMLGQRPHHGLILSHKPNTT